MQTVCGVAVRDCQGSMITSDGSRVVCPIFDCWRSMIYRCYSEKRKATAPTYRECRVCDEWMLFSNFKRWAILRFSAGLQLDKDILFPGNQIYSPDTCVFVTRQLNMFAIYFDAPRGKLPLGVHYLKKNRKFQAKCRNPFLQKSEHLGLFESPESAHNAWRYRKHQHACTYADMQTDPRIARALRSRFLPQKDEEIS